MFERARFGGLPGGGWPSSWRRSTRSRWTRTSWRGFLRAVNRLEAWAGALKTRGIVAFAEQHRVADPDSADPGRAEQAAQTAAHRLHVGFAPQPQAQTTRDRTCRFPGCPRRARVCQLDHTIPWPHGPTCPCNLAPLCTRHHRLKTHTGWRLAQPWPGTFLWRSPTGAHYLVDTDGTIQLDTTPTTEPETELQTASADSTSA